MDKVSRMIVSAGLVIACAGGAWAQGAVPRDRVREPEAAIAAAVANTVFLPVRLGVTAVGGALGGLVGFLTAGNRDAAGDVWALFEGQNIITPEMAAGRESLEFGSLEFGPSCASDMQPPALAGGLLAVPCLWPDPTVCGDVCLPAGGLTNRVFRRD